MYHCGIIGGEELALLGDLSFLREWKWLRDLRPSALGMWRIFGFVGLVMPDYFFEYLLARASRHLSIQVGEKPVQPGTDSLTVEFEFLAPADWEGPHQQL